MFGGRINEPRRNGPPGLNQEVRMSHHLTLLLTIIVLIGVKVKITITRK